MSIQVLNYSLPLVQIGIVIFCLFIIVVVIKLTLSDRCMKNMNNSVFRSIPANFSEVFPKIKIRRTSKRVLATSLALMTCLVILSPLTTFQAVADYARLPNLQQTLISRQPSNSWPWENSSIHPLVTQMPRSAETSITSVAQYIAQRESNPFLVVKAFHDYVATKIDYDYAAYLRRYYPPQDAQTVFRTRKGVCTGYARLMQALGNAVGLEVAYITGDYRTLNGSLSGEGHAWNGIKINDKWYLMDVTWDAGYVNGSQYVKHYRTNYLLTPPEVMIMTHLPNDPGWQLLPRPLSSPEFVRQPTLQPEFFAEGFRLISPKRSDVKVLKSIDIQLENSKNRWIMAEVVPEGNRQSFLCSPPTRQTSRIPCSLPGIGRHEIRLFSSQEQYGTYQYLGAFRFTT